MLVPATFDSEIWNVSEQSYDLPTAGRFQMTVGITEKNIQSFQYFNVSTFQHFNVSSI